MGGGVHAAGVKKCIRSMENDHGCMKTCVFFWWLFSDQTGTSKMVKKIKISNIIKRITP
jgi:hypothetical protein